MNITQQVPKMSTDCGPSQMQPAYYRAAFVPGRKKAKFTDCLRNPKPEYEAPFTTYPTWIQNVDCLLPSQSPTKFPWSIYSDRSAEMRGRINRTTFSKARSHRYIGLAVSLVTWCHGVSHVTWCHGGKGVTLVKEGKKDCAVQ
eukprot:scaffold64228_cov19-Tisochrysis_lutea.AAC.1